jgi:hypothetical protein
VSGAAWRLKAGEARRGRGQGRGKTKQSRRGEAGTKLGLAAQSKPHQRKKRRFWGFFHISIKAKGLSPYENGENILNSILFCTASKKMRIFVDADHGAG